MNEPFEPLTRLSWLVLFASYAPELERIVLRFKAATKESWDEAVKSNNPANIHPILEAAWFNAPDQPWIHEIPAWGVLCDLCSDFDASWGLGAGEVKS